MATTIEANKMSEARFALAQEAAKKGCRYPDPSGKLWTCHDKVVAVVFRDDYGTDGPRQDMPEPFGLCVCYIEEFLDGYEVDEDHLDKILDGGHAGDEISVVFLDEKDHEYKMSMVYLAA